MVTPEEPAQHPTLPSSLAGGVGRFRSNLALALLLLPSAKRRDAFLFHDFCRHVDDISDRKTGDVPARQALLGLWLEALQPGGEEGLPGDFREMMVRRELDRHLLSEIVLGVRMDTERNRYATFMELRSYCLRVASAVGLVSVRLFGAEAPGPEGAAVTFYAEELGLALQLTNILRDIAEDATMGRIYLPLEDLERFGVSEGEILQHRPSPAMTHLLNHHAERADSRFAKAEVAWSEMSANQRRMMRPARLMSAVYRDLLLQMHRDRYDIFHRRYRVSPAKKLLLAARVLSSRG